MSGVPGTQEEEKKPIDQSAHINLKVKGQNGLASKVEKSRKQMKERKNRARKIRGVKKTKAGDAAKGGKKK